MLQQANHERRYFPFAATGINVTQFILELLQTSRLHALLFIEIDFSFDSIDGVPVTMTTPAAVRSSSSSSVVPVMNISKDVNGVGARCEQKLHEIYSLLYCEFTELWVKRDPANVMEFPKIFGEFKDDVRGRGQFQPVNLMLRK